MREPGGLRDVTTWIWAVTRLRAEPDKFRLIKVYVKQAYTITVTASSGMVTVRNRRLPGFDALRRPVGFGLLVV